MDTTDPDIQFDPQGVCNYCHHYKRRAEKELGYDAAGQEKLRKVIEEIKSHGKGKEYDCVIGLSGGVDSTAVAYYVKQLGLRPLAVHLDNGWNSELAVSNVEGIVKTLNIDLFTYIIDWEEFKDLQLAFLKASVTNLEIPTDHAINSLMYQIAAKRGIKYIIGGGNIVTEAIMPESWGYDSKDWKHIKAIYRRFGRNKRLKSFPHTSLPAFAYYFFVKRIKYFPILNYIPYVKKEAIQLIERELGWRNYHGKHYESIFTRFFQGYILPTKFNIDKRKAHFSTLICSGQMTRVEALKEMEKEPYPPQMVKEDKSYVLKKFGLTEQEFDGIMSQPIKSPQDYPSSYVLSRQIPWMMNFLLKVAKR